MPSKTYKFQTDNPGRGFHSVMEMEYGAERADELFDFAAGFIKESRGICAERAIGFLDSRFGRHFGDRVADIAAQEPEPAGGVRVAIQKAADHKAEVEWRRELSNTGI